MKEEEADGEGKEQKRSEYDTEEEYQTLVCLVDEKERAKKKRKIMLQAPSGGKKQPRGDRSTSD